MDTKTVKQEVLDLLDMGDLSDKQVEQLNYQTATLAGYHTVSFFAGEVKVSSWDNPTVLRSVNYVQGIEAVGHCLTLPLPVGFRWVLVSPMPASEYQVGWALITQASQSPASEMHRGQTLPLAMLAAWWGIQS